MRSITSISRASLAAAIVSALLAGCGGGYGGGAAGVNYGGGGGGSQTLQTATLNGSPGFVAPNGHTVYVFDADLGHTGSVCTGACAQNWPPLTPPGALTTGFSSFTRVDSSTQLSYGGRPLYMFVVDTAAGQTNGDGVNAFGGLWHIARPASSGGTMPPVGGGGGGPY